MTDIEISRRERKKEETKQRIFKVAIKLFRERGFPDTTVDDIAERADVSKGTFFNYFPRKEAVLAYLSEQRLDEAEANGEAILSAKKPARQKLIDIYVDASKAYAEDRELSSFVFNELLRMSFSPAEETGRRWDQLIGRIYEQGRESGELRREVEPARAIAVLTSIYYGLLYIWSCCPEMDLELEAEMRARLALVLDGIAKPAPGRAAS
jgi:AcrR family transcriptional regulator